MPGLADALQRLNSQHSPVWTSKCDVWPVLEPLDADEMGTSDECTAHAWACYIDLLPRSDQQWGDQQWIVPEMVVSWCRVLTEQLRGVPLSCCRVDFIVRRAVIGPGSADIGITAYLTACGANVDAAKERLQEALGQFVEVFFVHSTVK